MMTTIGFRHSSWGEAEASLVVEVAFLAALSEEAASVEVAPVPVGNFLYINNVYILIKV